MNQTNPSQPLVSVVMPCYNRAAFLREALQAIVAQTYPHWELILVDDGSTDNTKEVLDQLVDELKITQPLHYIYQANGGAYAARNTGLSRVQGQYVALYDSDDLWLPHHLHDGVKALEEHPEIDWVYADCKKVDLATGRVVADSGFRESGKPHPFMTLKTIDHGRLRIFDDPNVVAMQLQSNLCCLLQTAVIRAKVFEGHPFVAEYRNEGEDELYPSRAIKRGFRLAYFDDVHLVYRFHADNSSTAAVGASIEKQLRVSSAAIRGYEEFARDMPLTDAEARAINYRLANEFFWKRGYTILWLNGRAKQAWPEFHKGIMLNPRRWHLWRAYLRYRLRWLVGLKPRPRQEEAQAGKSAAH